MECRVNAQTPYWEAGFYFAPLSEGQHNEVSTALNNRLHRQSFSLTAGPEQ